MTKGISERSHVDRKPTNLEHDCALKDHQHEAGEKTVVPVFIQAPEGDAEDLENEEGCDGMLCEKFRELGNWNVAGIRAEFCRQVRNGNVWRERNLGGSLNGQESGCVLEDGERGTGVTGIRQRGELQCFG
jgi:hypothetical protein